MNKNDDKIREILQSEEVPEEISPENMKKMLDTKTAAKKRNKISAAGRITAVAAACTVIIGVGGGSVYLLRNNNDSAEGGAYIGDYTEADSSNSSDSNSVPYEVHTDESGNSYAVYNGETETTEVEKINAPYMNSAESYEQIYQLISDARKNNSRKYSGLLNADNSIYFDGIAETADDAEPVEAVRGDESYSNNTPATAGMYSGEEQTPTYIAETNEPTENTTEPVEETSELTESGGEITETDEEEYSETHNQEENVLEADIVKTDGKKIYRLSNFYNDSYNSPVLNIASVEKGTFTDSMQIEINPETYLEDGWENNMSVSDMYLYNDMIAVIGNVWSNHISGETYDEYNDCWYNNYDDYKNSCFVSFYTKDAELIGTYWQEGNYKDVRIAPDGYMYLVSDYYSYDFEKIEDCDDIEKYIPQCGVYGAVSCMQPEDILLPENELDNSWNLSYTIIGSIDLTVPEQFTPADSKALAGYTGELYSSADNIYTAVGWEDTQITRISVNGGNITPAASGKVEGYVKDQFSMSEYNGFFRVATTVSKWNRGGNFITDMLGIDTESEYIQDNRVYILDMDMNIVGSVEGFGENETIKSVNFSGNMGYVVTYEQTDPLFAIDLTNPAEPFITDEFKILGYSTYMQSWTDGLLLGFGIDADENGIENGIKLVMFDNSDPYNLQEVGLYSINNGEDSYIYSGGVWERKQLLIAPEKNLIGVPAEEWNARSSDDVTEYMFFSYENGEFIPRGKIAEDMEDYITIFDRALYIGDYVYILSDKEFIAADIETISITDRVYFD